MRSILPVLLAVLLLVSGPVGAAWDDDNGTGTDASGNWFEAMEIGLGVVDGEVNVHEGDGGDWYVVALAPSQRLRVQLEGTIAGSLEFRDEVGTTVRYNIPGSWWGWAIYQPIDLPVMNGTIRIGLGGAGVYRFHAIGLERPDLAVAGIEATTRPVTLLEEETPASGVAWRIEVDVTNHGLVGAQGEVEVWITSASGNRVELGKAPVQVASSGSSRATFDWSSVGSFGDMVVHARVQTPLDYAPGNDEGRADLAVVLGGTGIGIAPGAPTLPEAPGELETPEVPGAPALPPIPGGMPSASAGTTRDYAFVGVGYGTLVSGHARAYPENADVYACVGRPVSVVCSWLP